ncbi:MAG: hypothetical protein ABR921_10335 [Candidatus Sulfotelmatobacter sp.]
MKYNVISTRCGGMMLSAISTNLSSHVEERRFQKIFTNSSSDVEERRFQKIFTNSSSDVEERRFQRRVICL